MRSRPFRFWPGFSGSVKRSSTCGSGAATARASATVKVSRPGTLTSWPSFFWTPIGPPSQLTRTTEAASPRSIPEALHECTRRSGPWTHATFSSRPACSALSSFSTPGASSTSAVSSRPARVWRLTSEASEASSPSTLTSNDWRIVPNTNSKRASGAWPLGKSEPSSSRAL